jgi:hypothetical protein
VRDSRRHVDPRSNAIDADGFNVAHTPRQTVNSLISCNDAIDHDFSSQSFTSHIRQNFSEGVDQRL